MFAVVYTTTDRHDRNFERNGCSNAHDCNILARCGHVRYNGSKDLPIIHKVADRYVVKLGFDN